MGKWSRDASLYAYYEHFRTARDTNVESATAFSLTHAPTSQAIFGGGGQNTAAIGKHGALVYGADYRSEDLWSNKLLITTNKATGSVTYSIPNGNVPPGNYNVFDAFGIIRWQMNRLTLSFAGRIDSIHLQSYPRPQDALFAIYGG